MGLIELYFLALVLQEQEQVGPQNKAKKASTFGPLVHTNNMGGCQGRGGVNNKRVPLFPLRKPRFLNNLECKGETKDKCFREGVVPSV